AEELGEVSEDRLLRLRADDGLDHLTAGVDVHRRDGDHVVGGGRLRVGVHVELADLELLSVLGRDLLQDRGDLAARAAPVGPEVYEHRLVGLEHIGAEGGVAGGGDGGHVRVSVSVGVGSADQGAVGGGLRVLGGQVSFGVQGGRTAGAGGGDRLPVVVVHHVSGGEDP